jgi:hypothetical protein
VNPVERYSVCRNPRFAPLILEIPNLLLGQTGRVTLAKSNRGEYQQRKHTHKVLNLPSGTVYQRIY